MKLIKLIKWTAIISFVIYLLPDNEEEDQDLKHKMEHLFDKIKELAQKGENSINPKVKKEIKKTLSSIGDLAKSIDLDNLRHNVAQFVYKAAKHIDVLEKEMTQKRTNKRPIKKTITNKSEVITPEIVKTRKRVIKKQK